MHEIVATIDSSDVRLCTMEVRAFDGYVKEGKTEALEQEDGSILFVERKRPVLSEKINKATGAFRMEVLRVLKDAGFKTPMGYVVKPRGLEELILREKELSQKAASIEEMMLRHLEESGGPAELAKCEVELLSLRITPDSQFISRVTAVLEEAGTRHLTNAAEIINGAVEKLRRYVEIGDVGLAARQMRVALRVLKELGETGWEEEELQPLRDDLAEVRDVLANREISVARKLEALDRLEIMRGVSMRSRLNAPIASMEESDEAREREGERLMHRNLEELGRAPAGGASRVESEGEWDGSFDEDEEALARADAEDDAGGAASAVIDSDDELAAAERAATGDAEEEFADDVSADDLYAAEGAAPAEESDEVAETSAEFEEPAEGPAGGGESRRRPRRRSRKKAGAEGPAGGDDDDAFGVRALGLEGQGAPEAAEAPAA